MNATWKIMGVLLLTAGIAQAKPSFTVQAQLGFNGTADADNTESERFSPGERYGRVYQINYLRCIGCGLCIEACPTRALTMTNDYEMADDNRADLILGKDKLLAPMQPGMQQPPHPMAPGSTDEDYYLGNITGVEEAR